MFNSHTIISAFLYVLVVLLWMTVGTINCQNATEGVRCLSCHEVASPPECTQWVTCGHEEECFVKEFQNRYMETVYRMGCELKQRCDFVNRLSALLGKRDAQRCFQCCDYDDCNSALCLATAPTPGLPGPKSRCFDCDSVSDPQLCDQWSKCGLEEICFTRSFMADDGVRFKMGCEHRDTCLPPRSATTPSPDPWQCTECCHYDDCNSRLCAPYVGYQGESSNVTDNGCPASFILGNSSCYYFSDKTASWSAADTRCRNMSASLLAIETDAEREDLNSIMNNTILSKAGGYWTGGNYITALRGWYWENLQPASLSDWAPSQPSSQSYTYRIVLLKPSHSTHDHWQWASAIYTSGYNYICETSPRTST